MSTSFLPSNMSSLKFDQNTESFWNSHNCHNERSEAGDMASERDSGLCLPPSPPPEEQIHVPSIVATPSLVPVNPDDRPLVAVIGVGYVGTHLVEIFAQKFDVLGFEVSEQRVKSLQQDFAHNERVKLTINAAELAEATHFLVSVPTLLLPNKAIDTSYLRNALHTISCYARPGATIVIESSVAVGMTRELVGPLAKEKGCFAGMSPEVSYFDNPTYSQLIVSLTDQPTTQRVDPGRVEPPAATIPKIVSGLDDIMPGSIASITKLYSAVFDRVVPVTRPEVAEMTKLYENCQRMMCIAYANEMADACIPFGINPYEVCEAAATKPFGYMPFYPSAGVGGHCIPVNPYYLLSNSNFPLLKAATEKMWDRPAELARRTSEALEAANQEAAKEELARLSIAENNKPTLQRRAKSETFVGLPSVLVVGVGFKRGQSTLSNSPGLDLAKRLAESQKVNAYFADPLVQQAALPTVPKLAEDEWTLDRLKAFHSIIVTVRQDGLDFGILDKLKDSVRVEWWCA